MSEIFEQSGLSHPQQRALEMLYHAFNVGDPDLLDEVLTVDWQDTPMAPGQQPGREGMKPVVKAFMAAFSDLKIMPQEVVGFETRAAVRLTLSGRHVGEWMEVPATGRTFTIDMHELHHLEGGRISHTWHLEDWAGWRAQVTAEQN